MIRLIGRVTAVRVSTVKLLNDLPESIGSVGLRAVQEAGA